MSDVDLTVIIDTENLGDEIPLIRKVIKTLRDNFDILYSKYRVGFEDYYYREKYTLNHFKKLNREGIIDDHKLEILKGFLDPYDHGSLKKNLKDIMEVNMSYTSMMRDTQDLKRYLDKDNFFVIKYIFKYGGKFLPIDLAFHTQKRRQKFINTRLSSDVGYLEAIFNSGLYYIYLKRLGSKMFFDEKTVKLGKEIKSIIRRQEKYISQVNQNICQATIDGDKEEEKRIEIELEKHFESLARKYRKKTEFTRI